MKRPIYNFAIDPELLAGLRHVKERDGVSESEQIRRGIRLWLRSKRVRLARGTQRTRRKETK